MVTIKFNTLAVRSPLAVGWVNAPKPNINVTLGRLQTSEVGKRNCRVSDNGEVIACYDIDSSSSQTLSELLAAAKQKAKIVE